VTAFSLSLVPTGISTPSCPPIHHTALRIVAAGERQRVGLPQIEGVAARPGAGAESPMRIDNEFVVKAPIELVWGYLLDVGRVAPCMPGAELTEVVNERTWKGKTTVKLGPVNLSFGGTVVMEERDDAAHRIVLKADGREQRGKGTASARVVCAMESVDGGTRVGIETDLTITGAVAQYGRGMVADISQRLTDEFAKCLEANIGAAEVASRSAGSPPQAPASESFAPSVQPVQGVRMGLWALWRAIARFLRRLFGGDG
jgi:uncharacterized protein